MIAPVRLLAVLAMLAGAPAAFAAEDKSFDDHVAGLEQLEGLAEIWLDRDKGRILLALPAPDDSGEIGRFIHAAGLTGGLGSNPVGLDRGSWSATAVLRFRLAGGKLVVEAENQAYRASAAIAAERRAVENSFARSVLWTAPLLARDEGTGRLLVDFTGFLLRDALQVAARLEAAQQGSFKLAAERSFVEIGEALVFPDNLEFDAALTFESDKPGREVRAVTPVPQAVTLIQHHSLVRLPDDGYRVREGDPRAAAIALDHLDYSVPLDRPLERSLARRFRLEKTDPAAARSPVKTPIVFYIDNGAPEPVRSALAEGVRWWAKSFEAAGFIDAFRVEILPEDAHPLDIRYNVVQWVHRQTRGWSFGGGIADPRTGEMLKGLIVLGSQRLRQDRMIFEGLAGTEKTGSGAPDDPVELALARVRQLAAHEVGHALGFAHNMAASTWGDRASVMDYPAPEISVREDGTLDFSRAYGIGTGAWDDFTVRWLYGEFPPGTDEAAARDAAVLDAQRAGMIYVADRHARPAGTAHPAGSLWDTGSDPVASLETALEVRAAALADFGARNLLPGADKAELHATIVPVYLWHRYQVEAAAKMLGGLYFQYGRAGDATGPLTRPDAATQRRALDALLSTIDPALLDLPDHVLDAFLPFADGGGRAEVFASALTPAFDPIEAARVAGGLTLDALLHPARLARMHEQHGRDSRLPGVAEVLDAVSGSLLDAPRRESPRQSDIRHALQERYVAGLIGLAGDARTPGAIAALAEARLAGIARELARRDPQGARLSAMIARFLDRPAESIAPAPPPPQTPPGPPIGTSDWHAELPAGGL